MGKFIDLIGNKYGRLTVISKSENSNGRTAWNCKCDCGNLTIKISKNLTNGDTKSCGCLHKENLKNNKTNIKHGKSREKIYMLFDSIKKRCLNKNNKDYKNYGARGIKICDEWLDKKNGFINFYNWATHNGYKQGLSIDRIDNDGNYEPSNCRWATHKEQQRNKNNNHFLTYKGQTKTMAEWSEILGIKNSTIQGRVLRKLPIEKILFVGDMRKEKT